MNTKTRLNRINVAIANMKEDNSLHSLVRLEQDWIGNVYAKFKGARIAPIIAKFSYNERDLAVKALKKAGFIKHPVKRGLGDRAVWVIPANEVGKFRKKF